MKYRDLNATVRALVPLSIVSLMVLLRVSLLDADAEVAHPADAFVDFVGVNTHLGYSGSTYGDYEGILKPRLNESDGRGGDWAARAREEQQRLYEAIKGNPATKDLPVAVSSMANLRDIPAKLGDRSAYLDLVNTNPYAAGCPPSQHWGWGLSMERAIAEAQRVSGNKPILVTECGYHNRVENQGHPGVTELAEAIYLPRLLFVYCGVKRSNAASPRRSIAGRDQNSQTGKLNWNQPAGAQHAVEEHLA